MIQLLGNCTELKLDPRNHIGRGPVSHTRYDSTLDASTWAQSIFCYFVLGGLCGPLPAALVGAHQIRQAVGSRYCLSTCIVGMQFV